ncbi:hypothetical protein MA16_Dca021630 [Dendrobium catenatum]|uniref:Uncharacterized protein n=1 Tax=Dendrobium catenatum TaxID=906689 RepID=A0A2I0WEX8_9ASPA|nr:hypothetical protein MA16_Dca021630 [Dendrobium catenatum]
MHVKIGVVLMAYKVRVSHLRRFGRIKYQFSDGEIILCEIRARRIVRTVSVDTMYRHCV